VCARVCVLLRCSVHVYVQVHASRCLCGLACPVCGCITLFVFVSSLWQVLFEWCVLHWLSGRWMWCVVNVVCCQTSWLKPHELSLLVTGT
jgi:hypothetical protein